MSRDTVIFNFRKGFEPLKEAFEANGYRVAANEWAPAPQLARRCEAAVVNLYEAIRRPRDAVGLHRRLRAAGAPLIGVDRDAPWHMGMRWRRLALFRLLRPLDIYATHTLQPTWEFAPVKIYNPNAVWTRRFNLHGHTLAEMRDPLFFEYDVSFLGNLDGERYREHAQRTSKLFLSVTKYVEWVREGARSEAELALSKARARVEKLDRASRKLEETELKLRQAQDDLAHLQVVTEETRARLSAFLAAGLQALDAGASAAMLPLCIARRMSVTLPSSAGSTPLRLMNASARSVEINALPMIAGPAPTTPSTCCSLATSAR